MVGVLRRNNLDPLISGVAVFRMVLLYGVAVFRMVLLCGVAVLYLGVSAGLQARADEVEMQGFTSAEQWNRQGIHLYDQGRFPEALHGFQQAFSIRREARFLFNAAKACFRLDDFECAVHFYQRYLILNPEAEDAREVRQEIDDWRQHLWKQGRWEVVVSGTSEGELRVNPPHETRVNTAPGTLFLAPGEWTLQIQAPGSPPILVSLTIHADSPRTLVVEPGPPPGHGPEAAGGQEEFLEKDAPSSTPTVVVMPASGREGTARRIAVVAAGSLAATGLVVGGGLWIAGHRGLLKANRNYDGSPEGYPAYRKDYQHARRTQRRGIGICLTGGGLAVATSTLWALLKPWNRGEVLVIPEAGTGEASVWFVTRW